MADLWKLDDFVAAVALLEGDNSKEEIRENVRIAATMLEWEFAKTQFPPVCCEEKVMLADLAARLRALTGQHLTDHEGKPEAVCFGCGSLMRGVFTVPDYAYFCSSCFSR